MLVHEVAHSDGDGEVGAFQTQFAYLADQGVIDPVSTSVIVLQIMAYPPEALGEETMAAFNGEFTSEMRAVSPGGATFTAEQRYLLGDVLSRTTSPNTPEQLALGGLAEDPFSTDYGHGYLDGVRDYFMFSALVQDPRERTLDTVSDAIDYADKKVSEYLAFVRTGAQP